MLRLPKNTENNIKSFCRHWIHVLLYLHVLDIAMSKSTFLTLRMFHDFIVLYVVYCVLYFSVFYIYTKTHTHTVYTVHWLYIAYINTFNKHNQNILTQQLCWIYTNTHTNVVHIHTVLYPASKQTNK